MNIGQEHIDIETYFVGLWSYTEVEYENQNKDTSNLDEWTRFRVFNAGGKQVSLGNNPRFRYRGLVVVQVFIRDGIGVGRAKTLADLVDPIFRNTVLGEIHFGVPEASKLGVTDGWYGLNVDCPYYREEF